MTFVSSRPSETGRPETQTVALSDFSGGARSILLPSFRDDRGSLSVAEVGAGLPFIPRRVFFVYDVPNRQVRGQHAHRTIHQLLVCTRGSLDIMLDDGVSRTMVTLSGPTTALHIPPMVWAEQFNFTPDAVMMVLASSEYDPDEYIRTYGEFRTLVSVYPRESGQ